MRIRECSQLLQLHTAFAEGAANFDAKGAASFDAEGAGSFNSLKNEAKRRGLQARTRAQAKDGNLQHFMPGRLL
jgi:hypothetical protein